MTIFGAIEYGDEAETEGEGFRLIWKRDDGALQAARGQARIPSMADILELTQYAMRTGWGNNFSKSDEDFKKNGM